MGRWSATFTDEPIAVPLDALGQRSRSLAPGDTTTLPWAAMGGFRLRALVSTGAVEVVRARTVKLVSEPDDQEEAMPMVDAEVAGNGAAPPRKPVRAMRTRRKRRPNGEGWRAKAKARAAAAAARAVAAEPTPTAANGHEHREVAKPRPRQDNEAVPSDTAETLRLQLAARVLGLAEGVLGLLRPA